MYLALVITEPSASHPIVLWLICAALSVLFLIFLIATRSSYTLPPGKTSPKITTDRAEKSCDAVLSVCALLIPATLGILTWLHERAGVGSYMIPLGFALVYFFALLIFTAHLRFNFLWRYDKDFEVDVKKNLRFGYWLTTATSSIVLGLILLSIPVLELGFGWLSVRETASKDIPLKVECNCRPADLASPPVSTQAHKSSHQPESPALPTKERH